MIKLPLKNPTRAKAITIAIGLVSLLVAHFLPQHLNALHTVFQLLGVGTLGAGSVQLVQAPKP
jgi:hypothetical protein